MPHQSLRSVRIVHVLPGRLRLRLPWLCEEPDEATALADRLASLHRSMDVEVRIATGSVLCRFDPGSLAADAIVAETRQQVGASSVLRPGERLPRPEPEPAPGGPQGESQLITALSEGMRGMNRELMTATGGRLDLGAVAGLGFLAAGAAEIAVTRRVPAPPWFNLAWWAFRTFTLSAGPHEEAAAKDG